MLVADGRRLVASEAGGSFFSGGVGGGHVCRRIPRQWRGVGWWWLPVRLGWFAGRGHELLLPEAAMSNIQFFAGAQQRRK